MAKKGFDDFSVKTRRSHNSATAKAKEIAATEETVRLNLEVPKSLRDAIKIQAVTEGLSMKEFGTKVFTEYLEVNE